MDWRAIQSVVQSHAKLSEHRLQIHHDSKVLPKDERMSCLLHRLFYIVCISTM